MKLSKKQFNNLINSFMFIISILVILNIISYLRKNKQLFTIGVQTNISSTLENLYHNHLKIDFNTIFPSANRNGGGAHFFAYAYQKFKNQHTPKYSTDSFDSNQFENFHKIYCAVSGSPIKPQGDNTSRTSDLKLKKLSKVNKPDQELIDNDFIIGKYYRCCTPCICDLMKHSVVSDNKIEITNDNESVSLYLILIKNPCNNPNQIPPQAPAFACINGMLDSDKVIYLDEITGDNEDSNYLVIGVLYDHPDPSQYDISSDMANFRCEERFTSDKPPGGMGEIFIKLSKAGLDPDEPYLGYIP
tara:strand:+ start:2288 stop:3193 length:906 start_codon:yes stop_codon:yes gene_type:complete